ncbi:MAG: hypothetical protein KGJ86_08145, partial [Chloroflexota bacterium]|nr:hypothetical protein [Chloroflexota bacterium]
RRLQAGRESAADNLAVTATGKPLALASALLRVWEASRPMVTHAMAVGLLGQSDDVPQRIRSLLERDASPQAPDLAQSKIHGCLSGVSRSLLTVHVVALVLLIPLLACGLPAAA